MNHLTLITSLKVLSSNIVTLGVRASTQEFGGHNEVHTSGYNLISWTLTRDRAFPGKRFKEWEEFDTREVVHWWLWRWRGHTSKECRQLPRAEAATSWQPARKQGPNPKLQGTEFHHNLISLDDDPELWIRTQPDWRLDFSFVWPWAENPAMLCVDLIPIDRELTNGCDFKLLSLWWLVMQKSKTNTCFGTWKCPLCHAFASNALPWLLQLYVVIIKMANVSPSTLLFLFRSFLAIPVILSSHVTFRISLWILFFTKETYWGFYWDSIKIFRWHY